MHSDVEPVGWVQVDEEKVNPSSSSAIAAGRCLRVSACCRFRKPLGTITFCVAPHSGSCSSEMAMGKRGLRSRALLRARMETSCEWVSCRASLAKRVEKNIHSSDDGRNVRFRVPRLG